MNAEIAIKILPFLTAKYYSSMCFTYRKVQDPLMKLARAQYEAAFAINVKLFLIAVNFAAPHNELLLFESIYIQTSVRNKCRCSFFVHFLHYMFRPLLVAIFRWFVIQKIRRQLPYISTDPLRQYV
jgi:hypothetical protein